MNSAPDHSSSSVTTGRGRAIAFVVLIGFVSLFADMTYEGGRSVAGPFLGSMGASAVVVSVVAGVGEFLGYGVRYVSGRAADRSGGYWRIMGLGYVINLLSVPLLAIAGSWAAAMVLLIAERVGRAIRAPIRGAMLSHAASHTGAGWAFGMHSALDQMGGLGGPLLIAWLLASGTGYRHGFALLLIPALASLAVLFTARIFYPDPRELELHMPLVEVATWSGFGRTFRLYCVAAALVGAGFVDFALIAFHLIRGGVVQPPSIPLLYALAMAMEGIGALVLGRLLDRFGRSVVGLGIALSALAVPLLFLGGVRAAIAGTALWGIGMATQDTVFHALLSPLVPRERRATAFGLFDALRGTAWLGGSFVLGLLYTVNLPALAVAAAVTQLVAIPVFLDASATPR
ncbi:MAG: MFS transporter [Rhodospirillales bacterium]|nr:MFS transporter [Rhodospirillales bacterium]